MEPTIFKPRLKFKPPLKFFEFGHRAEAFKSWAQSIKKHIIIFSAEIQLIIEIKTNKQID